MWDFDAVNRKVRPTDVALGQNKRSINCLTIDEEDQTMFCGSQSGDVLHVDLASKNFLALGPKKRFNQGVTAIAINPKTQEVLCGSGGEEVGALTRTRSPKPTPTPTPDRARARTRTLTRWPCSA